MVAWIQHRIAEPSTWAAIGAGVVGIGVVISEPIAVIAGIAIAIIGLILREKGAS
jgi:hypothetical protein|tara:strand:- start:279 stop:443 length:165 start_codon:yes stop_codon:yes gene_type:complete